MHYLAEPDEEQYTLPASPGISLREFMEQTTVYEDLPASFDPRLRRGAWTGMVLTLLGSLVVFLLSQIGESVIRHFVSGPFFVIMPGQLNVILDWMIQSPWVAYVDASLLSSAIVLLIGTRNLRSGRLAQHWLAFVQALGGTANLIMLVIPALLVLVNLLLWLFVIFVVILLAVGVFWILTAIL